jgi:hypothetical protein
VRRCPYDHERTGPIHSSVGSGDHRALSEVRFRGNEAIYPQVDGPLCLYNGHKGTMPMADYFADDAPQIDFGDGSFLIYSHLYLYVPPAEIDLGPVLDQTLEVWDWKGTNPRIESQGLERRSDAIQYRVVQELQKEDFDVIFDDDDGTGELSMSSPSRCVKRSSRCFSAIVNMRQTDTGAARLDDVYEVAGQALKSVQFCHKPKRIIRNMINRERRRRGLELPAKVVQERLGYSTIANDSGHLWRPVSTP